MRKALTSLFVLLLLIPTLYVIAQDNQPTPSLEITGANASDLPIMTITTNVLDSNNLPVENLTADNFTLGGDLDGLAEIVSVENISTDDLPFATVLVIDTSTSMSGSPLQAAKDAATLFVRSVGSDDPIAIVAFSSRARLVQDFTTDSEQLLTVIDNLQVGGNTALYDAAVLGIDIATNAPTSRRAVILLSDGAEFGGSSAALREDGLGTALRNGVSVYTIGLGFGIDRSYLQDLSAGSNARNYESPTVDELSNIYAELAGLFRTQYILTLMSDIPFDGTEYEFTLQATTPTGATNVDTGVIRAPVPVPIVALDDSLFTVPISEPTEVMPTIIADDDISEILVTIDDEPITTADGTFIIDPIDYPPGPYTLSITVTDVDGDSGSDSVQFTTAAIGSEVTINFDNETPITEPVTITIDTDGQTPVISTTYTIRGEGVADAFESTDAENGFPFIIDPYELAAGDYTLSVGVINEGGAATTISVPFSVASIPPGNLTLSGFDPDEPITEETTFSVQADVQPGTEIVSSSITVAGDDTPLETLTINPVELLPGELDLQVTVTDSNDQTITETITVTIASLPPQIAFGDLPETVTSNTAVEILIESQTPLISLVYSFGDDIEITLNPNADGTYPPIPLNVLMLGEGDVTLVVTATNQSGVTATESRTFSIEIPPTPTPTPNLELTANAQATSDARITQAAEAALQATVDFQLTQDAQAELDAQATVAAEVSEEAVVQATADAQATADMQLTTNAQATVAAEVSEEAVIQVTVAVQLTADAQATLDTQAENNAQATADAQATLDTQAENNAQATADAQATLNAATDTVTPEPTATITNTPLPTPIASLTPVEIVDVGAQDADNPPLEGNITGILVGIGAGLLGIILLAIVFFGRRSDNTNN